MPSHPGRGGVVHAADVFEIANAVRDAARSYQNSLGYRQPSVRFVNSTDSDAFRRRRDVLAKTRLLEDGNGNWLYFPEVIRSWDGMQLAWEFMDIHRREQDIQYDLVAVLGLDLAVLSEIDLFERGVMDSGMRRNNDFVLFDIFSSSGELPPSPDRGIVMGSHDAIKIWMTERFHQLDNYLDRLAVENSGIGFVKDRFLADEMIPRLSAANVTMNFHSSFRALDVMPNDSVSLTRCGNIADNERILQRILYHHSCEFSSAKIGDKSESSNQNAANSIHTAAICTIVTNEEYYLDEWIDYHLAIGFSHFYLCELQLSVHRFIPG